MKLVEHIEVKPDDSQLDAANERGNAIDADLTKVELEGAGINDLVSGHQYNLRGDFVETTEKKRFRFYDANDLTSSEVIVAAIVIAIAVCGGIYFNVVRRLKHNGKSA